MLDYMVNVLKWKAPLQVNIYFCEIESFAYDSAEWYLY